MTGQPGEIKRFKLEIRYDISAEMVRHDGNGNVETYGRSTGERLSIQDTFDLPNSMALTDVLTKINAIHEVIKP